MTGIEIREARAWCYSNNIRIYPVTTKKVHSVTKMVYGRKKKYSLPKCRVEVNLDGYKILGSELWEQDNELAEYLDKLYIHYYNEKSKKK